MTIGTRPKLDGRYILDSLIGAGTYAEIFRARDTETGELVAVKTLRPEHATAPQTVSLFAYEGEIGSSISHTNVVRVRSHGEDGGKHFVVMDLVRGVSLRRRLTLAGQLPVGEALRIMDAILQGLQAIHDAGFIHRDIKPQNILLEAGSTPKITDFGIAVSLDESRQSPDGITLGTAAYISPEQAAGQEIGAQADLYSAGAVLFEMLTGEAPFPGDDPIAVMNRHLFEPPRDPRTLNHHITPALAAVVLRALAKEPGARFSSAAEMREALAALEREDNVAGPRMTWLTAIHLNWVVPLSPRRQTPLILGDVPILTTFVSALLLIVFFIVLVLALVSTNVTPFPSPIRSVNIGPVSLPANPSTPQTTSNQIAQAAPTLPSIPTGWAVTGAVSTPLPESTLAPKPSPSPKPANLTIYAQSLASGWDTSLSWSASLNLVSTAPIHSGLDSISYTATDGWAGLQLRNDGSINTATYSAIRFSVRASKDGEPFAIYLRDSNYDNLSQPMPLSKYGGYPVSTKWTTYTIPLADLNASNVWLGSIVFHNWTNTPQPPIYITDIQLIRLP